MAETKDVVVELLDKPAERLATAFRPAQLLRADSVLTKVQKLKHAQAALSEEDEYQRTFRADVEATFRHASARRIAAKDSDPSLQKDGHGCCTRFLLCVCCGPLVDCIQSYVDTSPSLSIYICC